MIVKTIVGSLIAGILYTIGMGLYTKNENNKPSKRPFNMYFSGIVFTVIIFVLSLILNVF